MKKQLWKSKSLALAMMMMAGMGYSQRISALEPTAPDLDAYILLKKGVGITAKSQLNPWGKFNQTYASAAVNKLSTLNAKWYYTWGAVPLIMTPAETQLYAKIDFIPMLWGNVNFDTVTKPTLDATLLKLGKSKFKTILLYNEPNHVGQANISPGEAAANINYFSNSINTYADNVGTPAAAGGANLATGDIPWLTAFLSQLNYLNPALENGSGRSSFMNRLAYHNYPDPIKLGFIALNSDLSAKPYDDVIVGQKLGKFFLNALQMAHRKYNRYIMITEFGIADWAARGEGGCSDESGSPIKNCVAQNRIRPGVVNEFLKFVLPELYARTYISKFAYFSHKVSRGEPLESSAVFNDDESLTTVGNTYASYTYNSTCQKGEYLNSRGNWVVWYEISCGKPAGHWNVDGARTKYMRELGPNEVSPLLIQ